MANYRNYCRECGPDPEDYEYRDNHEKYDKDESKKKPEKKEKKRFPVTILNCGTGNGLTLPISSVLLDAAASNGNGYYPTLVVGSVTLDSRGLEKPTVKIDFSSMINFIAASTAGDFFLGIIFQLSRSCNNGFKIPFSTWLFERSVSITGTTDSPSPVIEFRDPFSFTWCECHDCPGCCTYLVEIIDISSYNIETASITNVGINAEAVGLPERE